MPPCELFEEGSEAELRSALQLAAEEGVIGSSTVGGRQGHQPRDGFLARGPSGFCGRGSGIRRIFGGTSRGQQSRRRGGSSAGDGRYRKAATATDFGFAINTRPGYPSRSPNPWRTCRVRWSPGAPELAHYGSRPSGADPVPWQRGATPNPGGLRDTGPAGAPGNAPGDDRSGCWVRVAEWLAGPNWGSQFLPRMGTEVLVDFIDGDIDRPPSWANSTMVVTCRLCSGCGCGVNHPGVLSGGQATIWAPATTSGLSMMRRDRCGRGSPAVMAILSSVLATLSTSILPARVAAPGAKRLRAANRRLAGAAGGGGHPDLRHRHAGSPRHSDGRDTSRRSAAGRRADRQRVLGRRRGPGCRTSGGQRRAGAFHRPHRFLPRRPLQRRRRWPAGAQGAARQPRSGSRPSALRHPWSWRGARRHWRLIARDGASLCGRIPCTPPHSKTCTLQPPRRSALQWARVQAGLPTRVESGSSPQQAATPSRLTPTPWRSSPTAR